MCPGPSVSSVPPPTSSNDSLLTSVSLFLIYIFASLVLTFFLLPAFMCPDYLFTSWRSCPIFSILFRNVLFSYWKASFCWGGGVLANFISGKKYEREKRESCKIWKKKVETQGNQSKKWIFSSINTEKANIKAKRGVRRNFWRIAWGGGGISFFG